MEALTLYQTNPPQPDNLPAKVSITLTRAEWQQLTAIVLAESVTAARIEDKYMKALLYPLLKQVYVKLHNKLHSLKTTRNLLSLTLPEASAISLTLQENDSFAAIILDVCAIIDRKLT